MGNISQKKPQSFRRLSLSSNLHINLDEFSDNLGNEFQVGPMLISPSSHSLTVCSSHTITAIIRGLSKFLSEKAS